MVEMCLTGHAFQKYMLQKCSASIDSYPNHSVICHKNGNFHSFQLVHHLIDVTMSVVELSVNIVSLQHNVPDSISTILFQTVFYL